MIWYKPKINIPELFGDCLGIPLHADPHKQLATPKDKSWTVGGHENFVELERVALSQTWNPIYFLLELLFYNSYNHLRVMPCFIW